MEKSCPGVQHGHYQGQILLEWALFCVGCEIIFTGTRQCPRCSNDETVWPLAEWLRSSRLGTMPSLPHRRAGVNESPESLQQHTPSAA